MTPVPPSQAAVAAAEPPAASDAGSLQYWRDRAVRVLLLSAVLLGILAYPPSVWLAIHTGVWSVAVLDTLVYAWLLVLTVWASAPYALRAWSITGAVYVLGVCLLAAVGIPGAGLTWLAMFPVLAAALLGLKAAVRTLAATAATLAGFAILEAFGPASWIPAGDASTGAALFVVDAANALLLSAAAAMPVAVLLRGLEETNHQLACEVGERRRVEADREMLAAQLNQAQKLEAVGRLAGGIAHDFNNLLTPILVYTEEARKEVPFDSSLWHRLGEVQQSAQRAGHLVRRILTFSRRAVVTRTPLQLEDLIRETGALLRATLPRMIDIQYEISTSQTTILADAVEVQQILMNLGTNALDAMREHGGVLTFGLADGPDDRLRITIRDTGIGMEAHVLERALEPFFTTKPSGKGTGLGLASAHGIVASLGGSLEIASEPGRGTTIEILLPRADARPRETRPGQRGSALPQGRGERVLLVDDEPAVLGACEMLLRRMGYEVTALLDPLAALAGLQRPADHFDVLVTDQSMPGMTGVALASEARRLRPDLAIVLTTGFLDEHAQDELEAAGIRHVLSKPYTPHELGATVQAALGRGHEALRKTA